MSEYQYQTLSNKETRFHTRIFVLDKGDFDQPITGTFEINKVDDVHISERSSTPFEAVSYAWEGQSPSEVIWIDRKALTVTKNVADLISHLRSPNQNRRLWIDAMCIDQDNDLEKANQVRSMQKIYRAATGVIIWLNVDSNTSLVAFNAACWFKELKKRNSAPTDDLATQTLVDAFTRTYPNTYWRAPFHVILNQPWFGRSWVLQEVILAQGLKVQMCRQSIDWDILSSAAIAFMTRLSVESALSGDPEGFFDLCFAQNYAPPTFRGIATIELIDRLKDWHRNSTSQIPPSKLVLMCRDRHASLPSDKIYSLAALFDLKCQLSLESRLAVDYRLDFKEVYKYFVKWCIEREGNLDILAQGPYEGGSGENTPQLPTWAFDWQLRERLTHEIIKDEIPFNPLFAEYMANIGRSPLSVIQVGNRLTVKGFIIDTVKRSIWITEEEKAASVQAWRKSIPPYSSFNKILFGHEQPTEFHLTKIWVDTVQNNWRYPSLWRDGYRKAEYRSQGFLTERGCLGVANGWRSKPGDKVCALRGGRALFILRPAEGWRIWLPDQIQEDNIGAVSPSSIRKPYELLSGDCIINGFENGQGVMMAQRLGIQEKDICLV